MLGLFCRIGRSDSIRKEERITIETIVSKLLFLSKKREKRKPIASTSRTYAIPGGQSSD
jgi:hypothetical protein